MVADGGQIGMGSTVEHRSTLPPSALLGDASRRRKETRVRLLLVTAAGVSIVVALAILVALVGRGVGFLAETDLSALWTDGWFPRRGRFDILTILAGSLLVSLVAMLVATPLGLGAAMYLSEYSGPRARRVLKPTLEMLASIPSVVLGFFALVVIQPTIVQGLFGSTSAFSLLAAGIGVGILMIPLVGSVAEDALRSVPRALREAAYGIGARRRTVTLRIVFPAAISGIVAALILGLSRALGETMVVAIAAGGTGGSERTFDLLGPGQTMTGAIASLAYGSDQVRAATGLNAFDSLYAVGLLLFVLTFGLNLVSERFVRKVRRAY
ncbi:MAG: phosphate ABC transporter permease subunit PstC [Actinomycetota bacterium]|nr:phosphate ABC transporter permease subunit PstC [Actinomycetota bacterium]